MNQALVSDRRVPVLKPGIRYTLDRDRGVWLLHTAQGTVLPPPSSTEMMGLLDGERDLAGIIAHMAETSGRAPAEIAPEVHEFFAAMEQRGIVTWRRRSPR